MYSSPISPQSSKTFKFLYSLFVPLWIKSNVPFSLNFNEKNLFSKVKSWETSFSSIFSHGTILNDFNPKAFILLAKNLTLNLFTYSGCLNLLFGRVYLNVSPKASTTDGTSSPFSVTTLKFSMPDSLFTSTVASTTSLLSHPNVLNTTMLSLSVVVPFTRFNICSVLLSIISSDICILDLNLVTISWWTSSILHPQIESWGWFWIKYFHDWSMKSLSYFFPSSEAITPKGSTYLSKRTWDLLFICFK